MGSNLGGYPAILKLNGTRCTTTKARAEDDAFLPMNVCYMLDLVIPEDKILVYASMAPFQRDATPSNSPLRSENIIYAQVLHLFHPSRLSTPHCTVPASPSSIPSIACRSFIFSSLLSLHSWSCPSF